MEQNEERQHEIENLRSFLEDTTEYIIKNYYDYESFLENITEYIIKNYDAYKNFLKNKKLAREESEEDKKAYYKEAYKKVTNYLYSLGFSNSSTGFDYLRDAILIYGLYKSFKAIDIDIAKKYCVRSKNVERYIRWAIDKAWHNGDYYVKKAILGSRYSDNFSRTEFIKVSHEILNLRSIDITQTINDISDIILNNPNKVRKKISKYLTMLDIPKETKAYKYLKEAIFIYLSGNSEIMQITTEIYPNIAKKYKTTIYAVERSIRYSVEIVFSKADIDILYDLFDNMIPLDKGKMTNFEFIRTIDDYVKFELY